MELSGIKMARNVVRLIAVRSGRLWVTESGIRVTVVKVPQILGVNVYEVGRCV